MRRCIERIVSDVRVVAMGEFKENFRRKAFFDQRWKRSKKGLIDSGRLRNSLRAQIKGNSIVFSSDTPYASIHNEGGEIKVTKKMKAYFWYKYKATKEEIWKAMALKREGEEIKIPQRQFIGDHSLLREKIEKVIVEDVNEAFSKMKFK
jgi:Mu-like prophage protein gpG